MYIGVLGCIDDTKIIELSADNREDALIELNIYVVGKFEMDGDDNCYFDDAMDESDVYNVKLIDAISMEDAPIEDWYKKQREIKDNFSEARAQVKERELYLELKKKYESNVEEV